MKKEELKTKMDKLNSELKELNNISYNNLYVDKNKINIRIEEIVSMIEEIQKEVISHMVDEWLNK